MTTNGWLVYRVEQGRAQILGVYETHEKAQADIDVLDRADSGGWQVIRAPFIGWAAVFTENGDPRPRAN